MQLMMYAQNARNTDKMLDENRKIKILVTGGSGFIGKPLVRSLDAKGYKVTVFAREDDIDRPDNVQLITGDITNKTSLRRAFSSVDAVYHLAASQDEEYKDMPETNILGTERIVELCKEYQVKQLIFMSFAGVLGETKQPAREHASHNHKTRYDKSKSVCENMIRNSGLTYTIIRAPLVMGSNIIWSKTIEAIKNGHPIVGSGKNKFHVVHIDDAVRILTTVLNNKRAANHVFHVATKDLMTYEDVYETICRELKIKREKKYMSLRMAHMRSYMHWLKCAVQMKQPSLHMTKHYMDTMARDYALSIEKAASQLGFEPFYTTPAAIHETIEDLRS
jgi:2-alkyl-3-oxoalkanoate reductase